MMRIFVYEHITGGALKEQSDLGPLQAEGDLMIRALLADLAKVPGVELVAMRDARLTLDLPGDVRVCHDEERFWQTFRQTVLDCEVVWPIAPETHGWLERISHEALAMGRGLLNSLPNAVRLAGSKIETSCLLSRAGIAVVPSYLAIANLPHTVRRVVVKPDDGAGCLDTKLVDRNECVKMCMPNPVFQPFIAGDPRSFSMLCSPRGAKLLSINRQLIRETEGVLEFAGVEIDAFEDSNGEIADMASAIKTALPGLRGFVGVDYIQTDRGPVVIEINPRLTSAYIGMSERLGFNVAARALSACELLSVGEVLE